MQDSRGGSHLTRTASGRSGAASVSGGQPSGRLAGLYVLVFLAFLLLYGLTSQRGPAWQDSGIYQWRIWRFELTGWLGLALAHPFLIVVGKAFQFLPLGDVAWRLNLVSAVCGAAAVANIALLVRRLAPQRPLAAWLAAGVFGLAHTTWWLATICESQMLLAAIFTLELNVLLSLVRRPTWRLAVVLGAVSGLGWTAHNLALLALPAYGLTVVHLCARRRLAWWSAPLMAAAWLGGGALLLALIGREAMDVGLSAAVHSALFGQSWRGAVLGGSAKALAMGCGYIAFNFANLALPLAVVGLWALRRSVPTCLKWAMTYLAAVYLLFAIRYQVPDQFMFFVPFYAIVAILAGLGSARLGDLSRWRWLPKVAAVSLALGPAIYAVAPTVWGAVHLPLPGRKDLAFRDPARYWLTPWKVDEESARRFARAALAEAPDDGIIIADSTSYYPLLWTRRVERRGSKVQLVLSGDATPHEIREGTPHVFVVSSLSGYCPAWLAARADLYRPEGKTLFRVLWRAKPSTRP
ncbi:MAG TPA: DUF2723 domain-containing protein [Phycisphaerae bacterium]|nr:DUF2723 domain-containing protein [Phycisphaerae bacterium]